MIAYRYGLTEETIYSALLELTRLHILHYVPRKRTPYVVYTTSREEARDVLIPIAVYEDLKKRMIQRIDAVVNYAFGNVDCRENTMLRYFGENKTDACGHCDVCIDRRKRTDHTPADVQEGILYMAQVKPRKAREFVDTLSFPADEVYSTLAFLVDEGFIEHQADDTYVNPKSLD